MDLLKWMAAREAIARDAGQPASQWYVHMDGDSWDFLVLSPTSSEEADQRASELMQPRGLSDGCKAFLEFRQALRSAEVGVGNEWVWRCRSGWWPYNKKKK